MCVCVYYAGCAWDTEEHSLWGSRKGGRQGSRVGVHACGARKLRPGSSEKPQKGKDMLRSCRGTDQKSETVIVSARTSERESLQAGRSGVQ